MKIKSPSPYIFLKILTITTFLFLYFPIVIIVLYSFQLDSYSFGFFHHLTFKWYEELFKMDSVMKAMKNTFIIAIFSSILSCFFGFIGAYAIYRSKVKLQKSILFINNIPIINPDLITGVSLFILFIFINLKLGFLTMLISHIVFSTPYAVLMIYPKMRSMPLNTIEASYDLGATEYQTITKIILPDVKIALLSAFLVCFTLSIDDFIVSFFTTGSNINNLSTIVYSIAKRGARPYLDALASIMFLMVFTLLFIINKKFSLSKLENIENETHIK